MNIIVPITRVFLGLIFLFGGVNGFFVWFSGLEPFIFVSREAMAILQYDYLLVVEKSLEVICGLLLLLDRYVPLALAILTPIIANILLLHLFIDPSFLALAILLSTAQTTLLIHYRSNFKGLFEKSPSH
ncbi:DoxX family membrane protein [Bacillus dakarensis]|uniref:DoxX family membrane protein n=1 Tax=Robertmurraya dakarensis TaxID=1926278 RepID=UPI000980B7D6|nr:DoxX family membrane protein [Bacillus dakarensis]